MIYMIRYLGKIGGKILKKLIRIIMALAGVSTGVAIASSILNKVSIESFIQLSIGLEASHFILKALVGLLFGLIIFFISPIFINAGKKLAKYIEKEISKLPTEQFFLGFIGLLLGVFLAFFIHGIVKEMILIVWISNLIAIVLYLFLGYLGGRLAIATKLDVSKFINPFAKVAPLVSNQIRPKVLDTSVIIDGRLLDICKTKFLEGPLIITEFVLKELRHIADASDPLKRKRGRRGLDILNKLQTEIDNEVIIDNTDFKDETEVDIKLLKLAQKINGMVATHDYNLNKVAVVHGVDILNINALANAVKPVVIPGEEMVVEVVKEGKENNQGLAYLDDGTMIVVEEGKALMGQKVEVIVTTALQTSAGKMIFVKVK